METPENLVRPYLFKDAGFRIEEEVRFVVHANSLVTSKPGGILIKVDAKALLTSGGFRVSPDLPAAERHCIEKLAYDRLQFTTPPPSRWAEESEFSFLQPFTKEVDDFGDVFGDLS